MARACLSWTFLPPLTRLLGRVGSAWYHGGGKDLAVFPARFGHPAARPRTWLLPLVFWRGKIGGAPTAVDVPTS